MKNDTVVDNIAKSDEGTKNLWIRRNKPAIKNGSELKQVVKGCHECSYDQDC